MNMVIQSCYFLFTCLVVYLHLRRPEVEGKLKSKVLLVLTWAISALIFELFLRAFPKAIFGEFWFTFSAYFLVAGIILGRKSDSGSKSRRKENSII